MGLLSSCKSKNSDLTIANIHLPAMPTAGKEAANELSALCNHTHCPNLTHWLNDLELFRKEYEIIRNPGL